MPEKTLLAFGDHGEVGGVLRDDGGDSGKMLARFSAAGVDLPALAKDLQIKARDSFVQDFDKLLDVVDKKINHLNEKQGGSGANTP